MKKILSVLTAVLLVAMACIPAFAADEIKIVPSATEAAVGDTITISFDISEGLTGVDASVNYDTGYLEYVKDSAVATDLMVTELNTSEDGVIKVASACTDPAAAGALFTAKFKVKKANAEITTTLNEVLDATDTDIAPGMAVAPVTIAEKAADNTTAPATTAPATNPATTAPATTKPASGGNSVPSPKTGNTPVIGSAAAILIASAAVAVVMKKKNED